MRCWFQTICIEFFPRKRKNSHRAHLVSVLQNKASFAQSTQHSTRMRLSFTFLWLSWYIPQQACLIHLTAAEWCGQRPALSLGQGHVNGQQPHTRCDRAAEHRVYLAFPPSASRATAQVSALSGADSPYLSSLANTGTGTPVWNGILHSKPGQDCINWGRKG